MFRGPVPDKLITALGAQRQLSPELAGPGEFYILGSGLTMNFIRDPDVDSGMARNFERGTGFAPRGKVDDGAVAEMGIKPTREATAHGPTPSER